MVDPEWGARGGLLGMAVSIFMFSLLGGGVWLYVHGVDAGLPRYISVRAHAFLMQDNRFILAPADVSISKVIAYKVDQVGGVGSGRCEQLACGFVYMSGKWNYDTVALTATSI